MERKAISIRHVYSANRVQTQFVNHVVVQQSKQGEFLVSLFEIVPPIISGDEAEITRQLEELQPVEATCIGRFVLTRDRLAEVVTVLAQHLVSGDGENEGTAPIPETHAPEEEKRAS